MPGPARSFGALVFTKARRLGWDRAQDTQVIRGGAVWIWNQAGEHFGQRRHAVGWCHAKRHLAEAARSYKGEGTPSYVLGFKQPRAGLVSRTMPSVWYASWSKPLRRSLNWPVT